MSGTTRKTIFEQASRKLRQDFDELSIVPHNVLKGSEAEKLVRDFLSAHLPKRFGVGAGFIIDPSDDVSKQTDIIVYDALNCPIYRASEDASIFPSDNVAAVVEVKSRLTTGSLKSAFLNLRRAKSLRKRGAASDWGPERTQTLGCVFAFKSDISVEKLGEHFAKQTREAGLGPHPDLLVVLDECVVMMACNLPNRPGWNPVFFEGFGEKTQKELT